MHDQPLAPADVEFIEDILLKYGDEVSVIDMAELDGYFTALVSGPQPVDVAKWFPAIWGYVAPGWESVDETQQFLDLCVRHMNAIASQLALDSQGFQPRFEQIEHQDQTLTVAQEWCFGYIRGTLLGNWPQLPPGQAALLQLIGTCSEEDNFELPADLDVALHQQQVNAIEHAARALHDYWLARR